MMPKAATADSAAAEITIFCLLFFFSSSLTFLIKSFKSTFELVNLFVDSDSVSLMSILLPVPITLFDHSFKKVQNFFNPKMGLK